MICHFCESQMDIGRYDCHHCGVRCEGGFAVPRLARLPGDMQELAEQILLAGGNLKEVSGWQDVSYPTLRKRVDALIATLESLRREDEVQVEALLAGVESGDVRAEYAARRIDGIHGGN